MSMRLKPTHLAKVEKFDFEAAKPTPIIPLRQLYKHPSAVVEETKQSVAPANQLL